MKTRQEIFDQAYIGMVKQGRRSASISGCHYTLVEGDVVLHCAIGHLFEEGTDTSAFNSSSIRAALGPKSPEGHALASELRRAGIDVESEYPLLRALQGAHDMAMNEDFLAGFKPLASKIADEYDLTIPEVTE